MNMISGTFQDKSLQCHAWIYERGNMESLLILAFFQIPTYTTWSIRHIILRVQCLLESGSPELRVWSSSAPFLNTSTLGTTIWAKASGTLHCGSQGAPTLFFETVRCRLFWAAHFQPHFQNKVKGKENLICGSSCLFWCIPQGQKTFFPFSTSPPLLCRTVIFAQPVELVTQEGLSVWKDCGSVY